MMVAGVAVAVVVQVNPISGNVGSSSSSISSRPRKFEKQTAIANRSDVVDSRSTSSNTFSSCSRRRKEVIRCLSE